ncbi:MAG: hypothetical protein H8F28_23455 [Fibrella sp.]|nr:hypothetical protein [Armatimonadota bacterium]
MTTTTLDEPVTEEQAREALRTLISEFEKSQATIKINHERVARARAGNEKLRLETRATLDRIQKAIDRF